ncbi:MAG: GNAT family N-acetyltransferase [Sulfitobacter sp.]
MITIDFAKPEEREEIAHFMNTSFKKAKWGLESWQRLLDGRWAGPQGRYAMSARDDGALVGVLGLVHATRLTDDGPRRSADMSSWYVAKTHRGTGLGGQMLDFLTSDPGLTITNLTSARAASSVIRRAGFQVLDSERLIWWARPNPQPLPLISDPLAYPGLAPRDRQVIADHQGLDLQMVVVETPDGPCALVLAIKRKSDDRMTHEVLYCGQPALFAKHARAIADTLLPQSAAILSIDPRLTTATAAPEDRETFVMPRYYIPGEMQPRDVNHLYTELVLLGIKLF